MSRTTPLPERPTSRAARLLLAGAVTATALVGVGAASADDGNPWALTAPKPTYLSTVSPAKVTLGGKGFTAGSVVTFTYCTAVDSAGTVVDATDEAVEGRGTKLVITPPACVAGAKPRIKVVTDTLAASTRTLYDSRITYVQKPVLAASPIGAPARGPWTGGTSSTIRLTTEPVAKASVQVKLGGAKPVPAKVSADDPRVFTFKTPAGTPGAASVQVLVFGIASDPVTAAFEHLSTIKVSPSTWVAGATAPKVKIAGAGFGTDPSKASVRVCGTAAAVTSVTDKAIVFTPPALGDTPLAAAGGGACTVVVDVDVDPAVTGERRSLPTAGSTFTYAAY